MDKTDVVMVLLIPITIFIPLMFMLSKNLLEKTGNIEQEIESKSHSVRKAKERINKFCATSGLYLHSFAILSIFQVFRIITGGHIFFNLLYFVVLSSYMFLEDVKDKSMLIYLVLLFGVIPFCIFTFIPPDISQAKVALISSMSYLLLWLYLPVKYHPLDNLHKMVQETKKIRRSP
jgi:hypothetical protein